jgi:hypothetical protein
MKPGVRWIARALALLWAGFWLFFFVVESWVWHTPIRVMSAWTGVGLLFILLALVPWRWEVPGGFFLIVAGILAASAYAASAPHGLPLASRLLTSFVFGGPPLLAGILFLSHHRNRRPVLS